MTWLKCKVSVFLSEASSGSLYNVSLSYCCLRMWQVPVFICLETYIFLCLETYVFICLHFSELLLSLEKGP